MITYNYGNLFDTQAPIIAHGCNCRGVMGAGVAKQIKQNFPNAFHSYTRACRNGSFHLGKVQVVTMDNGRIIANLATQEGFGSNPDVRYAHPEHVRTCLNKLISWANDNNIHKIAMPRIGCGLGGLDWDGDVVPILNDITQKHPDISIEVWSPKPKG